MARKYSPDRKPYSPVDEKITRSLPSVIDTTYSKGEETEDTASSPVTAEEETVPSHVGLIPRTNRSRPSGAKEQTESRSSHPERLNKQFRFQVSDTERREIRRIVSRLSGELETSVDMSHVARALLLIFRHAEADIMKHVHSSEPLVRPDNNNAFALAEFEYEIAKLLLKAFQDMSPIRSA